MWRYTVAMPCFGFLRPHPEFAIHVAVSDQGIIRIGFGDDKPDPGWTQDDNHPLVREARRQLKKYFAGRLRQFDLPLDLEGTAFQRRVWNGLLAIPYGETRSYSQLAEEIGAPRAARAVGSANHANPVAIVVPCHRVIAADGSLGGYGGGLYRKRFLLELEGGIRRQKPADSTRPL